MNTKNNRRFREMEIRLEAATLELMKHTDFEKITVKKICETAGVNRSSFYAHFTDIYDLLDRMETFLHQELLESYTEQPDSPNEPLSAASFLPFLKHIKKHQYFYRIALKTRRDFPLRQGFEELWEQVIKPRCEQAGVTSEEEMLYYFVYFQAGFTMVLKRWVDSDCREEETKLIEILQNCVPAVWK